VLVETLSWELRAPSPGISDEERDFLRSRLRARGTAELLQYDHAFRAGLYGAAHPYARPSVSLRSLDRIDTDALRSWARSHIVPARSTLILAGKFEPNLVVRHIAYHTDHVASGKEEPRAIAAPSPSGRRYLIGVGRDDAPTVQLDIGFAGGSGIDRHLAARLVVSSILESKLRTLRDGMAATYGFRASYAPARAGGMWRITGETSVNRAAEVARVLQQILAELRGGPDAYRAEFVHARRKVVESLLAGSSDSAAIAQRLVQMARFDLAADFFDQLVRQIAALRLEDVDRLIRSELAADRQVFGAFGPRGAARAAIQAAREPVKLVPRPSAAPAPEPQAPEPQAP
jgi:predicted Zn-dependent peptidase